MVQKIFSTLLLLFITSQINAQLVVNEVSQGTGTAEYVELVVVGTRTCTDSTANIQGWILDDNCGFYGGNGIAGGNIRFSASPQWANIKYGSIILLYNAAEVYPGIVSDETDANGDDVYILPSNSAFFESNSSVPVSGSPIATYTSTGYSAGGSVWSSLGMSNSGDAFHTVNPTNLSASFHSVGWGSVTATSDIYFTGSASAMSMVNINTVNNDYSNQANWSSIPHASGTPGVANGLDNLAWINTMKTTPFNCDFCISDATLWVKGDTGALNGTTNITNGTVTEWDNLVPNVNIPSLNASGTPQLVQNLPAFNFNSAMFFQNNFFIKQNLLYDALVNPSQGTMFVVSTTPALSLNFAVDGPSTGTCGGNRCSTGFRGNRSEFNSDNNLFAAAHNAGIANVISMSANDATNTHTSSVNGTGNTNTSVSTLVNQSVPFSVSIGRWPGYTMNNQYVAEALAFNRELTQNEVYQVESYLAIKYGVSLAHDYSNSGNSTLWSTGNGFDNNIAGISRDDCFGLSQTKSKSVHPNASLTVALTDNGGTFANPNDFTNDLTSLSWGNDGNPLSFTCSTNTPATYNLLLDRNWLTEASGTFGNVSMSFDLTPFNPGYTASDVALVIDVNQNGLYSDDVAILPNSIVGNELFFDNVSLTDSLMFSLVMTGTYIYDTITETICSTDSFLFNSIYYNTAGTYTALTTCDSIITLNLNLQVCSVCEMDLGNDTLICGPVNYTLNAGVFDEYVWQDGSTNQTFTATGTGLYWCEGTSIGATNLVVNGDFQAGAVDFTTDYSPGSGGAWGLLSNPSEYAVSTSPSLVHNNFLSCGDHTTGTGNMFVANGSSAPNSNAWCQTITVSPNTDYIFSAWAINADGVSTLPSQMAELRFSINGTAIGSIFSPSVSVCNWTQFEATWNSGALTSINICIENTNLTAGGAGADFALDDIFFGEICIATDTINILSQTNLVDSAGIEICFGESALIFGNSETAEGLYLDTLRTAAGCDSLYLKRYLEVGDDLSTNANVSICFGDSVFLQNAWQNISGTYYDTLQSTSMCDSLITTILTVSSAPITTNTITCTNTFGNQGVFIDTVLNTSGCASEYNITNIEYTTPAVYSTSSTICEGQSEEIFGTIETQAGVYFDTVFTTLGCDSILRDKTLIVNPSPSVSVSQDTTILSGQNAILTATGADTYEWNTGVISSVLDLVLYETTTFSVTGTSNNCNDLDSVTVFVLDEEVTLLVPTAFTPNADGLNDVFRIANEELFENITIRVYNRWGDMVFDGKTNEAWNGQFNNIEQAVDNYTYYIEATAISSQENFKMSGSVSLIR